MQRTTAHHSRLRAGLLVAAALTATTVLWRLRPGAPATRLTPDADVVRGCLWLAWLLAEYLGLAVAATAVAELAGPAGRLNSPLRRLAPRSLRAVVHSAVSAGIAATVLTTIGTPLASATPAGRTATTASAAVLPAAATSVGLPLDWPGLADPAAPPVTAPRVAAPVIPAPSPKPHRAKRHSAVGLVTGGATQPGSSSGGPLVVQPGDTLWSIAERQLPAGSGAAAITAAWHAWYAANRRLIGPDPGLLFPGQRLMPPPGASTQSPTPR